MYSWAVTCHYSQHYNHYQACLRYYYMLDHFHHVLIKVKRHKLQHMYHFMLEETDLHVAKYSYVTCIVTMHNGTYKSQSVYI